jgi:glutaredoxin
MTNKNMPKKKKYLPLVILLVIAIGGFLLINLKKSDAPDMILFYGDTCPHCKKVSEYIESNNVKAKFKFQELEVYNNQNNSRLMAKKAVSCGLDTSQGLGVPFFFDGKNCLVGDQDIINFFQK